MGALYPDDVPEDEDFNRWYAAALAEREQPSSAAGPGAVVDDRDKPIDKPPAIQRHLDLFESDEDEDYAPAPSTAPAATPTLSSPLQLGQPALAADEAPGQDDRGSVEEDGGDAEAAELPQREGEADRNETPDEDYDVSTGSRNAVNPDLNLHSRPRRNPQPIERFGFGAANVSEALEPSTYRDADQGPNSVDWKHAMKTELDSINEHETYVLVPCPLGRKVLPCKWVYKVKTNPDGSIERFKARLVVGGHRQRKGVDYVDYSELYAPVTRFSTLRTLLAVTVASNWGLLARPGLTVID